MKKAEKFESIACENLLTEIFISFEIITLNNPIVCNYFCSENVIKLFINHYHPQLTRLIRNVLKTLSVYKYRVTLDFIVQLLINTQNPLREKSDTILFLGIIKYSLIANDVHSFTLFGPLIETIIKQLSKFVYAKVDLYLNNKSEFKELTSEDRKKINIERQFGNFISEKVTATNTEDVDDSDYLEKVIIVYFKILYHTKDQKYFSEYIKNHYIKELSFLEYFAFAGYKRLRSIPPHT